ncbi:MAG: acyltransferase [Oscillospiraceae bacterium]
MRLKKILFVSILKTIIFNFSYFELKRAIKFPVWIGKSIELRKLGGRFIIPHNSGFGDIKLGIGTVGVVSRYEKGVFENTGCVIFHGKANLGCGSSIVCHGNLNIGKNLVVTARSSIYAYGEIEIKDNVLISWDVLIMDTDTHKIYKNGKRINEDKKIVIGNNVWIGCRSTVLKGTIIGDGSILGSNSIASGCYENKNRIIIGNKSKEINEMIRWEI